LKGKKLIFSSGSEQVSSNNLENNSRV